METMKSIYQMHPISIIALRSDCIDKLGQKTRNPKSTLGNLHFASMPGSKEQSFVHGFPNINAPSCNNSQGNHVRKFILIDKTKTA